MNTLKKCSICKQEKELTAFSKHSREKDGHRRICKACISMSSKQYHIKNRDIIINKVKLYAEKHKEKLKKYKKRYREENKLLIKEEARKNYLENKEEKSKKAKEYYRKNKTKIVNKSKEYIYNRMKTDSAFKINARISTSIYQHLKRFKLTKRETGWQNLLGYNIQDLISHLESKFTPEMTWENYGTYWHIDHIKPKSWFIFETTADEQFKKCWALENLQPLEASKNLKKGNRYEGSEEPICDDLFVMQNRESVCGVYEEQKSKNRI